MGYLNKNNIETDLKVNSKQGGKGEFYLFQIVEGQSQKENIIYSNHPQLHPEAVTGSLNENIFEDLKNKLRH